MVNSVNILNIPRHKKELKSYVYDTWGVSLPDTAVSDGNISVLDFVSDVFFENVSDCIAIGSRGSGKTLALAALHALNCMFKKNCEILTSAAIKEQALKCYGYFSNFIKSYYKVSHNGNIYNFVSSSKKEETKFRNGSSLKCVTATIEQFNSPHAVKNFLDEFELVEWLVFQEFLNMGHSTDILKAQNVLTSTRKYAYGTVERLLRQKDEMNFKLYKWNVFDVGRKCNEVSCVDCKKLIKGSTKEGKPRSFADICRGKLRNANGFRFISDIKNDFIRLDKNVWEAQQECLKPSKEGCVFYWWDESKHYVDWDFSTDRKIRFYEGIDWGGRDPNVCVFWMECDNVWLMYDELYVKNVAPSDFAHLIKMKREYWKNIYSNLEPITYADPSSKISILEFEKANICVNAANNDILEGINIINSLGSSDKIYINKRCENAVIEFMSYHYPSVSVNRSSISDKPVDKDNHTIDASRYVFNEVNPLDGNNYSAFSDVRNIQKRYNKKDILNIYNGDKIIYPIQGVEFLDFSDSGNRFSVLRELGEL